MKNAIQVIVFGFLLAGGGIPLRGAILSVSWDFVPVDTNINLTAEGRMDWIHTGLYTEETLNRKYGVAAQLTRTVEVDLSHNGPYWLPNSGTAFSWTDGTPTLSVSNTETCTFVIGLDNGFIIQCPAGTNVKTLRLYVGIYAACGQLTAGLSGGGVTTYTNTDYCNTAGGSNAVYTIDFQGDTNDEILTVTFTLAQILGPQPNANLLAATLYGDNEPPVVAISSPTNSAVFTAPATFDMTAVASDSDGSITNLQILSNGVSIAQSSISPLTTTLTNVATNTSVFTGVAWDDRGFAVTSAPVTVYVITGGGMLIGSVAQSPSNVNLTAEGKLDWAHWGLFTQSSYNRPANLAQLISTLTIVNGNPNQANQYADNFTAYSWTNGMPIGAATNTQTGLYIYNLGRGFVITVQASPTPRRLRVFLGLYGAQGRLEAFLSDASAAPYADTSLLSAYNNLYAVYTFTYASGTEPATLTVRWVSMNLFDELYGNITWQAVTLANPPAPPVLIQDGSALPDVVRLTFDAQSGVDYTVWHSDSLSNPNWQVLTNVPGNDAAVWIDDPTALFNTRFYRVSGK